MKAFCTTIRAMIKAGGKNRSSWVQVLGSTVNARTSFRTGRPEQAMQLCEERRFDCVLLDYKMPNWDGSTLAGQLRASHPYLATVMMTRVGDAMLAAEALRSGVSDYIPKSHHHRGAASHCRPRRPAKLKRDLGAAI